MLMKLNFDIFYFVILKNHLFTYTFFKNGIAVQHKNDLIQNYIFHAFFRKTLFNTFLEEFLNSIFIHLG